MEESGIVKEIVDRERIFFSNSTKKFVDKKVVEIFFVSVEEINKIPDYKS